MARSNLLHLESTHNNDKQQQQLEFPIDDEKLPLKYAWSTYFYKADKQRDWKQNVIYITSINYVEDFWSFYTHTYALRDLSNGSDYMFFKAGCLPMWEDVSSRGGGKWLISIDPKRRQRHLDSYWLHLMLLLIGNAFGSELSSYINGAVVSLRVKVIKTIGMKLKDFLGFTDPIQLIYEYHEANDEIRLLV